jgi:hypothetical protein
VRRCLAERFRRRAFSQTLPSSACADPSRRGAVPFVPPAGRPAASGALLDGATVVCAAGGGSPVLVRLLGASSAGSAEAGELEVEVDTRGGFVAEALGLVRLPEGRPVVPAELAGAVAAGLGAALEDAIFAAIGFGAAALERLRPLDVFEPSPHPAVSAPHATAATSQTGDRAIKPSGAWRACVRAFWSRSACVPFVRSSPGATCSWRSACDISSVLLRAVARE